MPRTGTVEWLNVLKQSARRAQCPWCKDWHELGQDLAPESVGNCSAVYARSSHVAICARVVEGGKVRKPNKAEIKKAVLHAWSRRK